VRPVHFRLCKGAVHGRAAVKSALQTTTIGGLAAAAAFTLAKLLA
jgi:hypothetical protein